MDGAHRHQLTTVTTLVRTGLALRKAGNIPILHPVDHRVDHNVPSAHRVDHKVDHSVEILTTLSSSGCKVP